VICFDRFPDVEIPDVVAPTLSLSTANKKEILAFNIKLAVEKFKSHKLDTGSTPVQSTLHVPLAALLVLSVLFIYDIDYRLPLTSLILHTVAVLTEKINSLFEHISEHKKDQSTKRGFQVF
jgi:ribosomal protein S15P/S13E